MNILFMSLSDNRSVSFNGLYTNLMRQFISNGNKVYFLSPYEIQPPNDVATLIHEPGSVIVKFKIGQIQKTNMIVKGINTLSVDRKYIAAIKKYLSDVKFDLVVYPTPPITLLKVVEYVKKRDGAKTYLLLKDIFPQNAVDIGIMNANGLIYKFFRRKERRLYAVSDYIGCMSKANVKYVLKHNPEIDPNKVEICPNTANSDDLSCTVEQRLRFRKKYGIPEDKTVFVYGGNLGKPQGILFLIECLKSQEDNKEAFFLIVGSGTEYGKIDKYIAIEKPQNVKLIRRLPKEDYDQMVGSCDVGMIFLDYRFTIPNFPSRMLSYMQAKLPILACTDPNTDIGDVIVEGGFGWWCPSNSIEHFGMVVQEAIAANKKVMGDHGFSYLKQNYTNEVGYNTINCRVRCE